MSAATTIAQLYTTRETLNSIQGNEQAVSLTSGNKLTIVSTLLVDVAGVTVNPTYTFEISPNEVTLQRLGLSYGELDRPGRQPLLQAKNQQLVQVSATVLVVSGGASRFYQSAQDKINGLVTLSELDANVLIHYPGVPPRLTWRITDLSIRSVRRNTSNEITIAEADLTFTESALPRSVVPGMATIKDVPLFRGATAKTKPRGDDARGGGSSCRQRSQRDRDADTACAVQAVSDAGNLPYP